MSYAGDVSCADCFADLQQDSASLLIDVRTMPEWNFVGVPNLNEIGKQAHMVEWQEYPSMQINSNFVKTVKDILEGMGADRQANLYCLCRSGVRSIAAAQALTEAGFASAYNVLAGFEGNPNHEGKRGTVSGWKFDGLPWMQR